jgi:hypothetical protein
MPVYWKTDVPEHVSRAMNGLIKKRGIGSFGEALFSTGSQIKLEKDAESISNALDSNQIVDSSRDQSRRIPKE